jgi:hypothetical protein
MRNIWNTQKKFVNNNNKNIKTEKEKKTTT